MQNARRMQEIQKNLHDRYGIRYTENSNIQILQKLLEQAKQNMHNLEEHKNSLYQSLFLTGKLNSHLAEIEKAAQERMDSQMEKLLKNHPAPDKEADPMAWTAHMNALMATAEESILTELVYS